jgi:hypothetical protein
MCPHTYKLKLKKRISGYCDSPSLINSSSVEIMPVSYPESDY